jgi:hypothetical protein
MEWHELLQPKPQCLFSVNMQSILLSRSAWISRFLVYLDFNTVIAMA